MRLSVWGLLLSAGLGLGTGAVAATPTITGSPADQAALQRTVDALHDGFARADLDMIMAYHHPDVVKALAYGKTLRGRDALRAEMAGTFKDYQLEFAPDETESFVVIGDVAIQQARFAIHGRPRTKGEPFDFRGRTQVIYVRYAGSPSGWASYREIIQPAS